MKPLSERTLLERRITKHLHEERYKIRSITSHRLSGAITITRVTGKIPGSVGIKQRYESKYFFNQELDDTRYSEEVFDSIASRYRGDHRFKMTAENEPHTSYPSVARLRVDNRSEASFDAIRNFLRRHPEGFMSSVFVSKQNNTCGMIRQAYKVTKANDGEYINTVGRMGEVIDGKLEGYTFDFDRPLEEVLYAIMNDLDIRDYPRFKNNYVLEAPIRVREKRYLDVV